MTRDVFPPGEQTAAFVGRVFGNPTVPTAAYRFVSVRPVQVSGPEIEGGAGTLETVDSTIEQVFLIGPGAPVAGDYLICRRVDHRWVAERMNGGGSGRVPSPDCPCATIPPLLMMSAIGSDCGDGKFYSATLRWQETPAEWASNGLGSHIVLSDETFLDVSLGEPFRYIFGCEIGAYNLRRIYPDSIFGKPYVDPVRYRWPFTMAGNNCDPFLLLDGAFVGIDGISCRIVVSE